MRNLDFPFQSIDTLTFAPKPHPLPANLRPVYRIALIVLVLKVNCRGNTSSLLKLQFFNWLLKNATLQKVFLSKLTKESDYTLDLIHLDPMVNLALKYAFADNLISVTENSKYKLEKKGIEFADRILQNNESVLVEERELLLGIGQQVSEVKLRNGLS